MSGRPGRRTVTVLAVVAVGLSLAAVLFIPVEVRHNAPLGVSQTIDVRRSIAVRGGYVTPNYDHFDRLDVDLRAYGDEAYYDLTLHVRPAGPDAPDVRTVALRMPRDQIWHDKGAYENAFLTVRFPEIEDSAGQRFYVWVEGGPRNRDDVWTLWRMKTYSTVPGRMVLWAWLQEPPAPLGVIPGRVVLVLLMVGAVGAAGWLLAAVSWVASTGVSRPSRE